MSPTREKRSAGRIQPLVTPCRIVHRGRRITGHLVDLSPQGGRVIADEPLPKVRSRIVLEARLGDLWSTRLTGEVKWVKAKRRPALGHSCGLKFRSLTPEQQVALESVLNEFRRRAAQLG